jgi:hypothetical protein
VARETRRTIVSAARELFVNDGYMATTIGKRPSVPGVEADCVRLCGQ